MAADVEFAIAVAARALVRHRATNPYRDVTSALAPLKMGAWQKGLRAVLVVGPEEAVTEIYEAVTGALDAQGIADAELAKEELEALARKLLGVDQLKRWGLSE